MTTGTYVRVNRVYELSLIENKRSSYKISVLFFYICFHSVFPFTRFCLRLSQFIWYLLCYDSYSNFLMGVHLTHTHTSLLGFIEKIAFFRHVQNSSEMLVQYYMYKYINNKYIQIDQCNRCGWLLVFDCLEYLRYCKQELNQTRAVFNVSHSCPLR